MTKYVITTGKSFCGSTLLDSLLPAASPDVVSVGEIHWLYDQPDFAKCVPCSDGVPNKVKCFLPLPEGPMSLYPDVAKACGYPKVLHTSDKAARIINMHAPKDHTEILLYKAPLRACASHLKHFPGKSLVEYLDLWVKVYDELLPRCSLVISYESLCRNTAIELHRICRVLHVRYREDWRREWRKQPVQHHVGGNTASQAKLYTDPKIELDDSYTTLLTPAEIEMINDMDSRGPVCELHDVLWEMSLAQ